MCSLIFYSARNRRLLALLLAEASYCRALPGLSFLLALAKRKQKASALSLGDPPTACRLNGTKLACGSDNIPFHADCTGWVPRLRNVCTEPQCGDKAEAYPLFLSCV
ncbi:hypothetical protein D0T84_08380, partial [Dysgonomonas sp. 521]|nr:hypothetical protein [Dysgonomonas sp. 521]